MLHVAQIDNLSRVLVLNLERSKKRKSLMDKQLNKVMRDYMFYPAFESRHITNLTINGNIGIGYGAGRQFQKAELAIIMSHLGAIKMAKMLDWPHVIILEDDVVVCDDWHQRLDILFHDIPSDWEYIYLSGHSDYVSFQKHKKPTVIKAPRMVGAFSYMVNHTAYDKIIKACTSFMTTFDDMIMNEINQGRLNGYVYFPFMTYHNAETSLIWGETAPEHSSKLYFKDKI